MTDGPYHPREPSPLEVAQAVLNPWNWCRLGLASQVWLMRKAFEGFTHPVEEEVGLSRCEQCGRIVPSNQRVCLDCRLNGDEA